MSFLSKTKISNDLTNGMAKDIKAVAQKNFREF